MITQAQFNSMIDNDIIDKSQEMQIKSALKLQELIDNRIKDLQKEIEYHHSQGCAYSTVNYIIPITEEIQSLVKESKNGS